MAAASILFTLAVFTITMLIKLSKNIEHLDPAFLGIFLDTGLYFSLFPEEHLLSIYEQTRPYAFTDICGKIIDLFTAHPVTDENKKIIFYIGTALIITLVIMIYVLEHRSTLYYSKIPKTVKILTGGAVSLVLAQIASFVHAFLNVYDIDTPISIDALTSTKKIQLIVFTAALLFHLIFFLIHKGETDHLYNRRIRKMMGAM